jgi:hypothetical protein
MSGQVLEADGLAPVPVPLGAPSLDEAGFNGSGSVRLVLGSDYTLCAGFVVIPAACHGTHAPAMATPHIELLNHRARLFRRQLLQIHAWNRGVKRLLRDAFRLAPSREVGHKETESQDEASIKEQRERPPFG